MKSKTCRGLSYIEVLIALALFSILLMAALPLLAQARRNMSFAQSGMDAYAAAQSIMLAARRELPSISAAQSAAANTANLHNAYGFSMWVFGETTHSFSSPSSLSVTASPDGLHGFSLTDDSYVVSVFVWDERLNVAGRAIGVR